MAEGHNGLINANRKYDPSRWEPENQMVPLRLYMSRSLTDIVDSVCQVHGKQAWIRDAIIQKLNAMGVQCELSK